jgi:hypothetical protein
MVAGKLFKYLMDDFAILESYDEDPALLRFRISHRSLSAFDRVKKRSGNVS